MRQAPHRNQRGMLSPECLQGPGLGGIRAMQVAGSGLMRRLSNGDEGTAAEGLVSPFLTQLRVADPSPRAGASGSLLGRQRLWHLPSLGLSPMWFPRPAQWQGHTSPSAPPLP